MDKVVQSAACVIPPEHLWTQIQVIRSKYDKAYERWMPHINMLYPFIPAQKFAANIEKLKIGLSSISPFTVKFNNFSYFEHGKSCTVFLKPIVEPSDALQKLEDALVKVFPNCDDLITRGNGVFAPHLTVGQFSGKKQTESMIQEFLKTWKVIEFKVENVSLISRSGTSPFVVKHLIPLGFKSTVAPANNYVNNNITKSTNTLQASGGWGSLPFAGDDDSTVNVTTQSPQPIQQQPIPTTPVDNGFSLFDDDPPYTQSNVDVIPVSEVAPKPVVKQPTPNQPKFKPVPKADGNIGIVLSRVYKWLTSQKAAQRPKTKDKLSAAILQLCKQKQKAVEINVVVQKLTSEGYISLSGSGEEQAVEYLKKLESAQPIIKQSKNSYFYVEPNDEEDCLDKCRQWVMNKNNNPKTLSGLEKSLQQLCIVTKQYQPNEIIALLEQKELLAFKENDRNDTIEYKLEL